MLLKKDFVIILKKKISILRKIIKLFIGRELELLIQKISVRDVLNTF
jgi:hypothetical protein